MRKHGSSRGTQPGRIFFTLASMKTCLIAVFFFFYKTMAGQVLGGNSVFNFLKLSNTPQLTALGGTNITQPSNDIGLAFNNPALLKASMHSQMNAVFNNFYGDVFPEPQALHTEILILPGTDGRKMSKSYDNAIYLIDSPDVVREKARKMITDRTRIKRTDPGHPEAWDVCRMHRLFVTAEIADKYDDDCRNARIGCVDRKRALADAIIERYGAIAEKSRSLRDNPEKVMEILRDGNARARVEAERTMREVHQAIRMDWE